jgi:hypothetical protein
MDENKLKEIIKNCRENKKLVDDEIQKTWDTTDYKTRLYITAYVMRKICDHARGGGTYRYLIYERLGFDVDAYSVLFPEGMDIANNFEMDD